MSTAQPSITSSPNRALAITFGSLAIFFGFFGFFFAGEGGNHFFARGGGYLFDLWRVNPALTVLWVVAGVALVLGGASTVGGARAMNWTIGVVFLVLAGYGLFFGNTSANIFSMNMADNMSHVIIGGLLVLTALGADKENFKAIRRAESQAA